jgi:hypothetical protein
MLLTLGCDALRYLIHIDEGRARSDDGIEFRVVEWRDRTPDVLVCARGFDDADDADDAGPGALCERARASASLVRVWIVRRTCEGVECARWVYPDAHVTHADDGLVLAWAVADLAVRRRERVMAVAAAPVLFTDTAACGLCLAPHDRRGSVAAPDGRCYHAACWDRACKSARLYTSRAAPVGS